ncbi:unnamed protein product [Rhizophagus irregularis]|nr:unnamed protein product [Rhizophagus irregularis]
MSPEQRERWLAAQAFIQDEKQESYEWLLRCCLEACEIPPLTFVTDADPAMIAAISTKTYVGKVFYIKAFHGGNTIHTTRRIRKCVDTEGCTVKFFLSQVQESIENQLEFELINNRYSIWKSSTLQYTQPFVIQTFFKDINITMKKYLTQPIHDAHYKQMCQSVCYCTHQVPFSEISASDDDLFEFFFDKEVDDSIETPIEADEDWELDLKSLISMVNSDDILEIWKVSRQISQKQLKFGTLMGKAKKAIQFTIQDDDEELIQFIREYNKEEKLN